MHQGGVRTSARGILLSFTIWDLRWPLSTSTARGRADPAEGLSDDDPYMLNLISNYTRGRIHTLYIYIYIQN